MPGTFEKAIFELSGQGIFIFGADFKIEESCSAECERIFGSSIGGKDAASLLFPDSSAADEFRNGLTLIFEGGAKPDVVFDLLESELEISSRQIHLNYRLLDAQRILVVLTDITRERRFQDISRRDLERRFIVLKAVSHRRYFAAFTQEARELFENLSLHETTGQTAEELQELSRNIHTFKGNASFFDFSATSSIAHQFESHLEEARVFNAPARIKEFAIELKRAYFSELNHIADTLGQRWIGEANGVNIPKRDYLLLEAWIRKNHPQDSRLAKTLLSYRREPFRECFVRFPEIASGLAEKLGKRLHPLIIEGGDFLVIPDHYARLTDVMVHLIRNALDHGIETPAERSAAGKDSSGSLRLKLDQSAGQRSISLSDDGRGIDPAAIETKARSMGLLNKNQKTSEAEIMQFLFHQGFSTSDTVTDISGRGIGLSAVKAEIDRLGGSIQIHSRRGRGTTFEISLPTSRKGRP